MKSNNFTTDISGQNYVIQKFDGFTIKPYGPMAPEVRIPKIVPFKVNEPEILVLRMDEGAEEEIRKASRLCAMFYSVIIRDKHPEISEKIRKLYE